MEKSVTPKPVPPRPAPRIQAWLNFQMARLRWPGMLGMALIVFALLMDATQVKPLEAALEAAARHPVGMTRTARPDALKPPAQAPHPDLKRFFAIAAQVGLSLPQGQYRLENRADGTPRLHIDQTIKADYPTTRRFLAQALSGVPGLSLTHLQLSRERIDEAVLSVHMQFILTLKKG